MELYLKVDGTNFAFSWKLSHTQGFCALMEMHAFYASPVGSPGIVKKMLDKNHTKEEAALAIMRRTIKAQGGSVVMAYDRVDGAMDQWLMSLPETFEAVNGRGDKVTCRVEKRDPYVNLNSGHDVREIAVYMTLKK